MIRIITSHSPCITMYGLLPFHFHMIRSLQGTQKLYIEAKERPIEMLEGIVF